MKRGMIIGGVVLFLVGMLFFVFAVPQISFVNPNPDNNTYTNDNWVFLNITSDEDLNQSILEWGNSSGFTNVSMTNTSLTNWYKNMTSLSDNVYNYTIWAQNTSGDWNQSFKFFVVVDTTIPNINFTLSASENGTTQANQEIFLNLSTNDTNGHYAFADFNNDLVLWIRMDDVNSSGDPTDLSSYNNNGSILGNSNRTINGYFGKGFEFDGVNDKIVFPTTAGNISGNNSFSISFWIDNTKPQASTSAVIDRSSFGTSRNTNFALWRYSDKRINFYVGDGSSSQLKTLSPFTENGWNHLVFVYSFVDGEDNQMRIYKNGIEQGTATNTSIEPLDVAKQLVFGSSRSDATTMQLNASLDEVAIFKRALSSEEILSLYNATANQYSHNFTSLNEGSYSFMGYTVDRAGNKNETETREITIDYPSAPTITLNSPEDNFASGNTTQIFNCSASDTNFNTELMNITFYWNYSGSFIGNGSTDITGESNLTTFTRTNLNDVYVVWNCYGCDNSSNCNFSSANYSLIIDTVVPQINFTSPTPSNGTSQSTTNVYVNVSSNDSNQYYTILDWNNSLVGWWRLEQINDTFFRDNSNYGINGVCNVTGHCPNYTSNGKFGGAYTFDGDNDYIEINNEGLLDLYWGIFYNSVQYGGGAATYPTWVRPMAIYNSSQNKTFFVYGDRSNNPVISFYDHSNKNFSTPVKVGINPDADAHKAPSILIDEDGYIYVFHGSHVSSPSQLKKSSQPHNISSWEAKTNISTPISYPQPWQLEEGVITVFYRAGGTYPSNETMIKSSDGGDSWGSPVTIVNFSDPSGIYSISIADTGNCPREVHLAWSVVNGGGGGWSDRKDVWYAYSDDAGTTWKMRNGTEYTLPITNVTGERVFESGVDRGVWLKDIQLDSNRNPYVLFIDANTSDPTNSSTYDGILKIAKYSGGSWEIYNISPTDHMFDGGALVIINNTYMKVYAPTTTSQEDEDGGEIEEWTSTDSGENWANTKNITSNSYYSHNYVKSVFNSQEDDFRVFWSYGDSNTSVTIGNVSLHYYDGIEEEAKTIFNRGWVTENLDIPGNISINMWIKINSLSNAGVLSTANTADIDDEQYGIWVWGSTLRFARGDGISSDYVAMSPAPPTNEWIYISAVSNETNLLWYLNGMERGKSDLTINPKQLTNLIIGALKETSTTWTFNGSIDEVQIYNRTLSPEEINASYHAGLYKYENNFTNLNEGLYTYKSYNVDLAGNVNYTEERQITIDTTSPNISFSCSPNSVNTGETITCSCSSVDNLDSIPDISYTISPTTSSAGDYTTTCTATDNALNINTFSIAYSVISSTGSLGSGARDPIITTPVSNESLKDGYSKTFRKNNQIKFEFNNEEVFVKVTSVSEDSVVLNISGEEYSLNENSTEKIDLDNDGFYDLEVSVKEIYGTGSARLNFKEIHEAVENEEQESVSEEAKEETQEQGEEIDEYKKCKWYWYVIGGVVVLVVVWFVFFRFRKRRIELR